MKGFTEPFRLDPNRNGGGVMIYIRDDIPSRLLLKHVFPSDIEGLYIELNFMKCKWLILMLCYVMLCIVYLKSMHEIVYNKKLTNID